MNITMLQAALLFALVCSPFASSGRPLSRTLLDLPEEESPSPAMEVVGGSIWSYISSRPDTTILSSLVVAAGLVPLLNSTAIQTLFLPVDSAFNSFFAEQSSNLEELISLPTTADLINYHIEGSNALSRSELAPGQVLLMLNGDKISISAPLGQELSLRDAAGRTVQVLEWDNQAGSSFVHIIDRLLVDISPSTINEALLFNSEFSTSRNVFIAARFADQAGRGGLLGASDANVTCLVPTNDAWTAALLYLGINSIDDLLNSTILPSIASGLIMPSVYDENDLESGAGSRYLKTLNSCSELFTQSDDSSVTIHGAGASAGQEANIIEGDLVAGKFALIHKLDTVIVPNKKWGGSSCRIYQPPAPQVVGRPGLNQSKRP